MWIFLMGWNHNKKSQEHQRKSHFQGLHMTHVISMLVYNLRFCILDTPFNITFYV
jgi:hypothetical protein